MGIGQVSWGRDSQGREVGRVMFGGAEDNREAREIRVSVNVQGTAEGSGLQLEWDAPGVGLRGLWLCGKWKSRTIHARDLEVEARVFFPNTEVRIIIISQNQKADNVEGVFG